MYMNVSSFSSSKSVFLPFFAVCFHSIRLVTMFIAIVKRITAWQYALSKPLKRKRKYTPVSNKYELNEKLNCECSIYAENEKDGSHRILGFNIQKCLHFVCSVHNIFITQEEIHDIFFQSKLVNRNLTLHRHIIAIFFLCFILCSKCESQHKI